MPTIQQVIDRILADVGQELPHDTVDRIKTGDPAREVTGIATSFMSTLDVLKQAAQAGANFVITHEPTFFNHRDEHPSWLVEDAVFLAKKAFIEQAGLTIWRFHDGWHMHQPDGINQGFLRQMGWEQWQDPEVQYVINHPGISLENLAREVKGTLQTSLVRTVGPADMLCRRILIMAGAGDGEWQIRAFNETKADVLICGEAPEWQTPEYFRDAWTLGMNKGLITAGHEQTEEAGMGALAGWLRGEFPGLPVFHIPSGGPYRNIQR